MLKDMSTYDFKGITNRQLKYLLKSKLKVYEKRRVHQFFVIENLYSYQHRALKDLLRYIQN